METTIRHSRAKKPNPKIEDWSKRYQKKSNLVFFQDALRAFAKQNVGNGGMMVIGLVGSRDIPGVTLRQAQSVLRWDLRPSLWSHGFLIADATSDQLAESKLLEVSLFPRIAVFPKPERNGVSDCKLGCYSDSNLDANVALLAVSMTDEEVKQVAARANDANRDRLRFNLWETLGVWQAYLWSGGSRPNPLKEGFPIAASSYLEYCFEGTGLDLTPGASERNSAPEHIWNAAKWWHDAFESQNRSISGFCVLRDLGCSLQSADEA